MLANTDWHILYILKQQWNNVDPQRICCLTKINIWQTLNLLISVFHKAKLQGEIAPEISRFSMENIHRDFIAIQRSIEIAERQGWMFSCNCHAFFHFFPYLSDFHRPIFSLSLSIHLSSFTSVHEFSWWEMCWQIFDRIRGEQ